jgi:hypothetical protein
MTQEDKEKAKTAEWPTWKGGDNMCGCGQEAQQGPYYGPLKTAARVGLYEEVGAAIGRLVDAKQKAYGRSFDRVGSILKILYPTGIKPEQYDDLGAMIRILDKFFRIATDKRALGESPWNDVAGYGLLMNRDYCVLAPEPQGKE